MIAHVQVCGGNQGLDAQGEARAGGLDLSHPSIGSGCSC